MNDIKSISNQRKQDWKGFQSHKLGNKWQILATVWWRPDDCLIIAWHFPNNSRQPPGTAWRLQDNSLTSAWVLPDRMNFSMNYYLLAFTPTKILIKPEGIWIIINLRSKKMNRFDKISFCNLDDKTASPLIFNFLNSQGWRQFWKVVLWSA